MEMFPALSHGECTYPVRKGPSGDSNEELVCPREGDGWEWLRSEVTKPVCGEECPCWMGD